MIGFLNGEVVARDDPHIVIDVSGVGYRAVVANGVLSSISKNTKIKLFIYTHVRDDAIQLYGFLDSLDLKLFEQLISVSGVGPKTAMNIFSVGDRKSIIDAIGSGDLAFFEGVPRLGRKNGQRIIIELKNKFTTAEFDLSDKDIKERNEIVEALTGFGFNKKEATEAIKVVGTRGKTVEEKIRLALKEMGK